MTSTQAKDRICNSKRKYVQRREEIVHQRSRSTATLNQSINDAVSSYDLPDNPLNMTRLTSRAAASSFSGESARLTRLLPPLVTVIPAAFKSESTSDSLSGHANEVDDEKL